MNRMNQRVTGALALAALCATSLSYAGTTPEATLKDFLAAMKKKDRKALKSAVDWKALGKAMGVDKEPTREKSDQLLETMKVVYVEGFALGKQADNFKIGKVTTKGSTAQGGFMRQDSLTKAWSAATQFTLTKEGKTWMITNIGSAPKPG